MVKRRGQIGQKKRSRREGEETKLRGMKKDEKVMNSQ